MTDLVTPQARRASVDVARPPLVGPYALYDDGATSIGLIDCARLLYRERYVIAAIVALFGLMALAAALLATPIYRAEVLLAPAANEKIEGGSTLLGPLGDLAALVGGGVGLSKDRTAESIATLRSRVLTVEFIQSQDLKPLLFPTRWDVANGRWRELVKPPTDWEAYDVFNQIRSVSVDRRSGLVSLAVEWDNPSMVAVWANRLVTEVNKRRRAEAIHDAEQSIKYLRQQLGRTSSIEIQQAIYRVIEANTKTIAMANAREDYAFRVVDPAVTPEKRIRPKRTLMVAGGLALGLFVSLFVVFVRRSIERERTALTSSI